MFTKEWFEKNLSLLTTHDKKTLLAKVMKRDGQIFRWNKQNTLDIYNHIEKLKKQWYFTAAYEKVRKAEYFKSINEWF